MSFQNVSGLGKIWGLPEMKNKSDIPKIMKKTTLDSAETDQDLQHFNAKTLKIFREKNGFLHRILIIYSNCQLNMTIEYSWTVNIITDFLPTHFFSKSYFRICCRNQESAREEPQDLGDRRSHISTWQKEHLW